VSQSIDYREIFSQIKIYGLVGKSGTGKSYAADGLRDRKNIDAIIDDGIFIMRGRILAGTSAKRRDTKIGAVRTALFTDDELMGSVRKAIVDASPESILIVGTSNRMVDIICDRLDLPSPIERIDIEEFTSEEDRKIAQKHRYELGGHVIPAPTVQIKKEFSGYFIHPLKSIMDVGEELTRNINPFIERDIRNPFAERTVVRPTYSYLGKFSISDNALADIVRKVALGSTDVDSLSEVYVRTKANGAAIEISAILRYGCLIPEVCEKLQKNIRDRVNEMTAINIISVDVDVKGLMWT
jgi:hypothetical protein